MMYLSLQQGQTVATTKLIILNDTLPEDDEFIYVYITSLTSGVNIARLSVDNGRKVRYSSCNFYFFCAEAVLRGGQGGPRPPCENSGHPCGPPNETGCKVAGLHNSCICSLVLHSWCQIIPFT